MIYWCWTMEKGPKFEQHTQCLKSFWEFSKHKHLWVKSKIASGKRRKHFLYVNFIKHYFENYAIDIYSLVFRLLPTHKVCKPDYSKDSPVPKWSQLLKKNQGLECLVFFHSSILIILIFFPQKVQFIMVCIECLCVLSHRSHKQFYWSQILSVKHIKTQFPAWENRAYIRKGETLSSNNACTSTPPWKQHIIRKKNIF